MNGWVVSPAPSLTNLTHSLGNNCIKVLYARSRHKNWLYIRQLKSDEDLLQITHTHIVAHNEVKSRLTEGLNEF